MAQGRLPHGLICLWSGSNTEEGPSFLHLEGSKTRITKIQTSKCINKIQFHPSIAGLNSVKRSPNPNDDERQMSLIIYLYES